MKNALALLVGATVSLVLIGGRFHQWLAEELDYSEATVDMCGFLGGFLVVGGIAIWIFAPNWKRPGDIE